jgi:hypothetical protein
VHLIVVSERVLSLSLSLSLSLQDAQDHLVAGADALLELDTALADEDDAASKVPRARLPSVRARASSAALLLSPVCSCAVFCCRLTLLPAAQMDEGSVSDYKSTVAPPSTASYRPEGSKAGTSVARSSKATSVAPTSKAGSVVTLGRGPVSFNVSHLLELGRIYIMLAKMADSRQAPAFPPRPPAPTAPRRC